MLQNLTKEQVEMALEYLYHQVIMYPPPKELEHLNEAEWIVLDKMLEGLIREQQDSRLQ